MPLVANKIPADNDKLEAVVKASQSSYTGSGWPIRAEESVWDPDKQMLRLEHDVNAKHQGIRAYMPDVIVCDASFISLRKLLPAALGLAREGAILVALVKPQFEVGKGLVGKGGIVRDPELHQQVLTGVTHWLETDMRWHVHQTMPSPITGPDGNIEFLLLAQKPD